MKELRFDEMKDTWHRIAKYHKGDLPANFELEVYQKLLNYFQVGKFYYYILNIPQVKMEYISESVVEILGISSPSIFSVQYIFENLHPEDKQRFILFEEQVTRFFNQLHPDEILKYKVSYDYRLRCADGSYKWILMQTVTLQSDLQGSVIRVLGVHTDIGHLKTNQIPSGLSFIGLEGTPSYYNVNVDGIYKKDTFSKREKEILQLITSGKTSIEISAILHISKNTVDSHRKKILSKSGCLSLAELGSKAQTEGWIF